MYPLKHLMEKIFLLLLLNSFDTQVMACYCNTDKKLPIERINETDLIFTGTILSIQKDEEMMIVAKIVVDKGWKNVRPEDTLSIRTCFHESCCGLAFGIGEYWVIWGDIEGEKYYSNSCTASQQIPVNSEPSYLQKWSFLTQFSGKGIWRFENGNIGAEGKMKNGKPLGVWKYFHEDGGLRARGKYKNGFENGRWKYYTIPERWQDHVERMRREADLKGYRRRLYTVGKPQKRDLLIRIVKFKQGEAVEHINMNSLQKRKKR